MNATKPPGAILEKVEAHLRATEKHLVYLKAKKLEIDDILARKLVDLAVKQELVAEQMVLVQKMKEHDILFLPHSKSS